MRTISLAGIAALAALTLLGCGSNASTTPPAAFELDGKWLYLGPTAKAYTIQISSTSMAFSDVDGEWSSSWSIKEYDNSQRHFQIAFQSGSGTYYPAGKDKRGAYVSSTAMLTVQLADGSGYPTVQSAGSCMDGSSAPIPDCGLYLRQ